MNLRLLKFILFLPLFIACQAGSEILPPDTGENGGASDFSCTLSAESLSYDHAYDYQPSPLTVSIGDETVVVDLSGAPWMEVEGDVTTISPNTEVTLNFVPAEPNYSSSPRTGVILLKGKYTGECVSVDVTQGASFQDAEESLLNGWRLNSSLAPSDEWKNSGEMTANKGDAKGVLTLVHSVNSPVQIIEDGNRGTFTGMRPGDAVLLRAPVRNLTGGTDVSAMICLGQKAVAEKCRWVAEYWDEDRWNEIRTFTTCYDAVDSKYDYNVATFICDFTLKDDIVNDYVKVRFRLEESQPGAVHFIAPSTWTGAALEVNSACPPIADYKKVLILGNSFTYYWGSPFVLKQIARSQGHRLDVRVHAEPGASLAEHDKLYSLSNEAVNEGGYDYVILQELSTSHAKFAANQADNKSVLSDANSLSTVIRNESLTCRLLIENTWAYPGEDGNYGGYGNYESFDANLQTGCSTIAKSLRAEVSPVCLAFASAREKQPEIQLLYTTNNDNHHPSRKGTYLKSCVNYLKIFGGEFTGTPYEGEVEDSEQAAALRALAVEAASYVPEEKPKERLTLTVDFTSWPFTPSAPDKNNKSMTKDAYVLTQDGVDYPFEIYAPATGYYYKGGDFLRFDESGGGYLKCPAVEGKALVEITVAITNTGDKKISVSSDGTDAGDILKTTNIVKQGSATCQLTGTMPGVSYYIYTKTKHTQISKVILIYESL